MKVSIEAIDDTSLTVEEAVRLAQLNYGKSAKIQVYADSAAPHDLIHFAIQQIITPRQLALIFDNKYTYNVDIKFLRAEVLTKLEEILDTVIIENETKVM